MLKLIITIFLVLLFSACSRPDDPLAAGTKARLVTELIIDKSGCSAFKNRLTSPSISDDAVEGIYHDAMKAHCVNKDI